MDDTGITPKPAKWWFPDDVERSVAGLYWVAEDGAAHFTLHARLGGAASVFRGESIPLLHGNVMGEIVTIKAARPVESTVPARGDVFRAEYVALLAFEGLGLREHELSFDYASFGVASLSEWADWTSWRDVDDDDLGKYPRLEYLGKRESSIECQGAVILLKDDGGWSQQDGAWTLTSGCRFELQLEAAVSAEDLEYRWLRPLQLLITTASARRAPLLHLSVKNSGWVLEGSDDDDRPARRRWVRVRFRRGSDLSEKSLSALHFRHRLSDFDVSRQIPAFFELAGRHRYALERYSDASSGSAPARETTFLNAIQAVESLDAGLHEDLPEPWQEDLAQAVDVATVAAGFNSRQRRLARRGAQQAHHPSLSQRLRRVDRETGGLVTGAAPQAWPEDVETLRNAVTHGRTGDVLRSTSDALVVATEIARFLWDLRWLVVLGFEIEDAQRLVSRRAGQWADAALLRDHGHVLHTTAAALKAQRS